MGWNQSSAQKGPPQTSYNIINKMNQVHYAAARQGTSHPPANSIRFQPGGSCNPNIGGYKRQNSYRKNYQKSMRGDSAKGARGLRQSMENNTAGYRLMN